MVNKLFGSLICKSLGKNNHWKQRKNRKERRKMEKQKAYTLKQQEKNIEMKKCA